MLIWIEAFLVDRKAQGMAEGIIYFCQKKLQLFVDFCESKLITQITDLTATA